MPPNEHARFFLLSGGYSEERIQTVLCPRLALSSSPLEPFTFGQLVDDYVKKMGFRYYHQLREVPGLNYPTIMDLIEGRRRLQRVSMVEKYIKGLQVPHEKEAEFMLLARGFPFEIVYDSLTAAGARPEVLFRNGLVARGQRIRS